MSNALSNVADALTVIGRSTLYHLESALILASRVTRAYGGAANAGAGDYGSSVQIADLQIVGDAQTRSIGGAATASDVVAMTRNINFTHYYIGTSTDNIQTMVSSVPVMVDLGRQLAYKLALKLDGTIAALHASVPYEVGPLDGTTAFATDADVVSQARRILAENQCPIDGNLFLALNTKESYNLRKLSLLTVYSNSGDASTLRAGLPGNLFGFEVGETQQIANATLTQADISWTVTGAHARGVTSLVTGAQGVGTVPAGMTFKIAGVTNATAHDVRFAVAADATISGSAATLSIYPALPVALSGGEVITAISHSAASSQNLAFHRDAILAVAQAPPPWPAGSGVTSVVVDDPQTAFALRLSMKSNLLGGSNVAFHTELVADVWYGARLIRPEFAVKIAGAVA